MYVKNKKYFKERGNDAIDFIEFLKHSKGEWYGQDFKLMSWQKKIIRKVFGTLNKDGTRQYRIAYIEIPRKNGKTEIGAAIALYLLIDDKEYGAEIYSAAGDRDQATLVYNAAAPMVRQSSALDRRCKIIDSVKRIVVYSTNSFYRVLSAEHKTKHGVNAHGVIFDELHVQPNRDLWDTLTTSGGTRSQPLVVAITTAGYDRNSICWQLHEYALKVSKGIVKDPTFYSKIYAADENDDWEDEKTWFKANPALDNPSNKRYSASAAAPFRSLKEMRDLYNKAKEMPALQNTFKRLYLNIWTSQETRWMDIKKWDATAGSVVEENLKGMKCFGGLDLSSISDITAFVLVFLQEGILKVLPYFFIPEDNMEERIKKDRVPYDVWVREGYIYKTPGNIIDYSFIEAKIDKCAKIFDILEIGYDPWNASMLTQRLADNGMEMIEIRQGMKSLAAPTKQLETLILQKKIHHNANPVLRWMFDNIMVKQDAAGNLKPDKEKSNEKIDGIVALIMAVDRAMRNLDTESVYEDRGVITI